jgi:hypothetical protein
VTPFDKHTKHARAGTPVPDRTTGGNDMTTADAGGYAGPSRIRSVAQYGALAFGAAFLLVGILGFIPGITTDYDDMAFAGTDSQAELLGVFQVSVLHNIVHLLFGALGLWAARTWTTARIFLLAGGAVYLVLFVYGVLVDRDSDANFVPVNSADDWLHVALAIGMLAVGLLAGRRWEDDPLVRSDRRDVRSMGRS